MSNCLLPDCCISVIIAYEKTIKHFVKPKLVKSVEILI